MIRIEGLATRWVGLGRRIATDGRLAVVVAVLLVLLLSYRTWQPLTEPGFPNTHDDQHHTIRLLEMDKCFRDGVFPCRWAQDLSEGYGYPIFDSVAPPLPYYIGELIHLTGFSILTSWEILLGSALVLSALTMFVLGRELWGNLGGLVASTFYVYAPYHAVDVYVRGALGEVWAFVFLPAILWGIYKVVKEGKFYHVLWLSLFTGLLLLTHLLTVMIFLPFALLWAGIIVWQTRNVRNLRLLALCGLWGLSLAAFYVLPTRFERQFVHTWAFKTAFPFSAHFAYLDQLFTSRFWGYGGSGLGRGDDMSFQIGWLHWGITIGALVVAPFLWRRYRLLFWVILFAVFTFWAAVFMTLEQSSFIWNAISDMAFIQFPWRFLVIVTLAASMLAGSFFALTRGKLLLALPLALLLIVGVRGLNDQYFAVSAVDLITDKEKFSGDFWREQTEGSYQYLVIYAEEPPSRPPLGPVDVVSGKAVVTNVSRGSASMAFTATTSRGATLRPAIHDYPGWKVRVDGETVPHNHENKLGLITFDLASGTHEIAVSLENTRVRTLADGVSMVAWAAFVVSGVGLGGAYVVGKVRPNSSGSEKTGA